jgi:hypothetical protein
LFAHTIERTGGNVREKEKSDDGERQNKKGNRGLLLLLLLDRYLDVDELLDGLDL